MPQINVTTLEKLWYIFGSQAAVGKVCGISKQAVCKWAQIPVDHVLLLEQKCGGQITRHEMRPDIYPKDEKGATVGDAENQDI